MFVENKTLKIWSIIISIFLGRLKQKLYLPSREGRQKRKEDENKGYNQGRKKVTGKFWQHLEHKTESLLLLLFLVTPVSVLQLPLRFSHFQFDANCIHIFMQLSSELHQSSLFSGRCFHPLKFRVFSCADDKRRFFHSLSNFTAKRSDLEKQ